MKVCEWYQWYPNDTLFCVMFYHFLVWKMEMIWNDDKTRDFGHTGNWDGVIDWNGYPKMASSTGNMIIWGYQRYPCLRRLSISKTWPEWTRMRRWPTQVGFSFWSKLMEPISWGCGTAFTADESEELCDQQLAAKLWSLRGVAHHWSQPFRHRVWG